jgi:NAD(P)-dependent dehydrogenase (short-subunit alcohol dehydrogenase family)
MDFIGKTILITGAAGGIGQSMCKYFADRGARIAALDISDAVMGFVDTLVERGVEAAAAQADIANADDVTEAISVLRDKLGTIDILVNNAGISNAASLETSSQKSWRDDLAINLSGAYHCTDAVMADLKASGHGAVVNISSVNGLSALGDPAYSAAKAGLISYTKSLAVEYGRYGVRANAVCPGTVRTPIWDHRVERNPEIFQRLVKWYPLGRVADPIDIAKAVAFLTSDDASAISGAVLNVDCGLSAGNVVMAQELTMTEY